MTDDELKQRIVIVRPQPNLQNIPIRTEEGRRILDLFRRVVNDKSGEHRREETQMTTERSCFTCRWAGGDVCYHPPCSDEMDVGIEDYVHAAACGNDGMPRDRTLACPGHESGEHRNEGGE